MAGVTDAIGASGSASVSGRANASGAAAGAAPGAAVPIESAAQNEVVRRVAGAVGDGAPIDEAIAAAANVCSAHSRQAWMLVAAAWRVATESGAPLAQCLRDLSKTLVEVGDVRRTVEVALAAPIATARMMTLLPVAGLAFGAVLGFDTVHTLFATVPGVVCLVAGSALLLVSSRWNALLVRAAQPRHVSSGLSLDLMAVAMSGGASLSRARQIAERAVDSAHLVSPTERRRLDDVLELAERAGVPAAELLRAEAAQARREALTASQTRAAALAVRLMLPLGLCVLPAFMLLGVAPLLISVVTSTFTAL
ncbi:MAG: Integral rane protein [Subtercola sp.]|nr:Integral rane protein [Subtercola sp.]